MPMPPRMHMGGSGTEKSEEITRRGTVTPQSALAKYIKETSGKEPHLDLTLPLLDLLKGSLLVLFPSLA